MLVDDEAPQRGATLARGAHGAEGDRAKGEVHVGGGADDGCVVASELEEARAKRAARRRGYGTAHGG